MLHYAGEAFKRHGMLDIIVIVVLKNSEVTTMYKILELHNRSIAEYVYCGCYYYFKDFVTRNICQCVHSRILEDLGLW